MTLSSLGIQCQKGDRKFAAPSPGSFPCILGHSQWRVWLAPVSQSGVLRVMARLMRCALGMQWPWEIAVAARRLCFPGSVVFCRWSVALPRPSPLPACQYSCQYPSTALNPWETFPPSAYTARLPALLLLLLLPSFPPSVHQRADGPTSTPNTRRPCTRFFGPQRSAEQHGEQAERTLLHPLPGA